MKVLLDIKDSKAAFVMELLRSLTYVKAKPLSDEKAEILSDLKEAVKEVKLHKQGKIKLKSAEDLINEL